MTITDIYNYILAINPVNFFFKAFAVVFSILFLLYALVFYKQAQEITSAIQGKLTNLILSISLIQIFVALVLVIFAFIL